MSNCFAPIVPRLAVGSTMIFPVENFFDDLMVPAIAGGKSIQCRNPGVGAGALTQSVAVSAQTRSANYENKHQKTRTWGMV
jgi:hypothetical protein